MVRRACRVIDEPSPTAQFPGPKGHGGPGARSPSKDRRLKTTVLGLYIHIPFCAAICNYCNFNRGLFDEAVKERYVDAIEREIRDARSGEPADTIYFGGGTPSLLEPREVARLISACRESFDVSPDAEVTLETNPETSSPGRMTDPVPRLSLCASPPSRT